jgi:hypothetical protein
MHHCYPQGLGMTARLNPAGRPRDGVTARQPRSKPRPQERPLQGYCTIHVASGGATTHPLLEAWMHDHTHPCPGATCRCITPNHRSQPLPPSRADGLWSSPRSWLFNGGPSRHKALNGLGSGVGASELPEAWRREECEAS